MTKNAITNPHPHNLFNQSAQIGQKIWDVLEKTYSRVQNKHTPMLINFLTFFQGLRPYDGLHRAYLSSIRISYKWSYTYSFCQIFQGLRLFKGVRLFRSLE